jgi:hypothetical protein
MSTSAEMDTIMAGRAQGIGIGDDADLVAGLHAGGLPDPVCTAALEALIAVRATRAR